MTRSDLPPCPYCASWRPITGCDCICEFWCGSSRCGVLSATPEHAAKDEDGLPAWTPPFAARQVDLANALEHIRRTAWAHAIGEAFEPKHMYAIAGLAAHALCGAPITAPVDMNHPAFRAMVLERHGEWIEACDDQIEAAADKAGDVDDPE